MLVPLTNSDKFALADDGWEEDLCGNGQRWFIDTFGYVMTTMKSSGFPGYKRPRLHQLIMGGKPGFEIDHINGNKLDNRTANLRFTTRSQSSMNQGIRKDNTSGYKGVWVNRLHRGQKQWTASVKVNGHDMHLGWFKTSEEAYIARKEAEQFFYGEYARKEI